MWDWDIAEHNQRFIKSLDPAYFEHIATIYGGGLQGDERQYAAIALRMAYSHGLESLLALLCATLQAPQCVVGWLLKYQNRELREVVRKITNYERVFTRFAIPLVDWNNMADLVLQFATGDIQKDERLRESFAGLWGRLAHDFLDEKSTSEYNSIKHGLRVHMGGFSLALGAEDEPGVPAPPEKMRLVGSSQYGTGFYFTEQLGDRSNLRLMHQSLNWNPEKFVHALNLISLSIGNVLSFLKIVNGTPPSEVQFSWPKEESYFHEPWKDAAGVTSFSMGSIIRPEFITPLSRDEILATYTSQAGRSSQD